MTATEGKVRLTKAGIDHEMESDGPYTCIRCLAATWNDSDICDDCAEEELRDLAGRAALSPEREGGE